jgi:predicted alpha/beta superfamily hydrolase
VWHSRRSLIAFVLLPLAACDGDLDAPADLAPAPALADSESRVVTSAVTGRDYQVTVALPRGYTDSDVRYPVLYAVDANGQFGTVVEAARLLRFEADVPELIIVGVGYPVGRMWNAQAPRAVDLTPTSDPAWVRESAIPELDFPQAEGSGGAPGFLRFFLEELIPMVESEYRADPTNRALYGHSFGGLFGAYSLLNSDGVFHRFIIASPSLWWHDRVTFDLESTYRATHDDLPARVFFSVGLLEDESRMVSSLRDFVSVIDRRNYEGLDVEVMFFPDENHNSVIGPAVTRGLRSIYRGWSGGGA